MKNINFNEVLMGRHSVKNYDTSVKISKEEMTEMLAEAMSAPSAINSQSYHFVVIDTPEGKEKMAELSEMNINQIATSSAVLAVFGDKKFSEKLDMIYNNSVEQGFMSEDMKNKLLPRFKEFVDYLETNKPEPDLRDWLLIDASLVSMQFMLVARAHGYDTNPIGGYDKENIAEAFGLEKERYVPVMIITIGKAATEGRPSYRLPVDTVTTWK